jgi:DNA-binding beta-propeller fold protein YncE
MKRLCLLSAGENKLTFYDMNLKKTGEFNVKGVTNAGPRKLAYAGEHLYSANSYDGSVSKIDLVTGAETSRQICEYPTGIAYIPRTGHLAVTCGETDRLIFIDKDLSAVDSAGCKSYPLCVTLSHDGKRLICACLSLRKIKIYDSATHILKSEIDMEGYPYYALEDEKGNIYATYSNDSYFAEGRLCFIDAAGERKAEGNTGKMPTAICAAEAAGRVYVANTGNNSVEIFEKETLRKIGKIETDYMPDDVLYDNGSVYITCMLDNSLIMTDPDGKHIKRIYTRKEPRGMLIIE